MGKFTWLISILLNESTTPGNALPKPTPITIQNVTHKLKYLSKKSKVNPTRILTTVYSRDVKLLPTQLSEISPYQIRQPTNQLPPSSWNFVTFKILARQPKS
ncbi:MAG: hypothetical protein K0R55_3118 [Sporomusa sp.]|jgi:hypothetical protein|nr:hypothetical protein [Sporomusa sp.]